MPTSSAIRRLASCAALGALSLAVVIASGVRPKAIDRIFGAAPAYAFDGSTTPSTAALSSGEALRGGAHAPETLPGKTTALTALQYAAEQGQPVAQWKLGRMYADGDGVPRDDLRAFSYFNQIANSHPDEAPGTPQARFEIGRASCRERVEISGGEG